MENYIGEYENLIKADEAGLKASIKRQREQTEYIRELEKVILGIYKDITKEKAQEGNESIYDAWMFGEQIARTPDPRMIYCFDENKRGDYT